MKKFLSIVLILVALAVYEGDLSWLTRPDAAWRQATDVLNDLVPAESFDITGRVVRVADGDTISVLDNNNTQHKVRFHGIDTPERDQPYGKAASRALSDLIADQRVGVLQRDIDEFGRTVGVVYLEGKNINLALVQSGHAWWYRRYAGRDDDLRAAEEGARAQRLGLWSAANPVPPWEWRRGRR